MCLLHIDPSSLHLLTEVSDSEAMAIRLSKLYESASNVLSYEVCSSSLHDATYIKRFTLCRFVWKRSNASMDSLALVTLRNRLMYNFRSMQCNYVF